jgi:hypothetical protein
MLDRYERSLAVEQSHQGSSSPCITLHIQDPNFGGESPQALVFSVASIHV